MTHIKRFNESKEEKVKDQEMEFNADSLEMEKDLNPDIKTEPVEHDEKELQKVKKNKIEKFESFITVNIDNVENMECDNDFEFGNDDMDISNEYDEQTDDEDINQGCGCCEDCTGEEGCQCECEDCSCQKSESDTKVINITDFINGIMSESIKYHLENNKPITENIFRPGSETFYEVIKEARELFDLGRINLCDVDKELYESTEIGKFGMFNGELVPLDIPMEDIEELNEAEYKGKEVKLNYPMRGGTKKYHVYVKNPKTGKVKKIAFGDVHGGLTAKVSDPKARKSFAARHQCHLKKDKTKAGYWSCRLNKYGHLFGGRTYPGFW